MTTEQSVQLDEVDALLIALLAEEPRIGVLECSRRLRVARGTVQARLDKLTRRGVIGGFGPDISPAAIGFGVTSFVTLEISQRHGHDPVTTHLAVIPEVLEAHTITGSSDLLCRIVARSNTDLQRVIDQIVSFAGITRASTIIALAEAIPYRTLPLVRSASQLQGRAPS
ncbi:Lrp/AsnC family transcriptional regulator [Micromonospora sp. WMMA1923]|uniref:Lrp/AsnC family transcriptional regulator n=1 Tax=Micromonospora sp. WMMA1923 TaxID=3404125 RepID=UPI003B95A3A8